MRAARRAERGDETLESQYRTPRGAQRATEPSLPRSLRRLRQRPEPRLEALERPRVLGQRLEHFGTDPGDLLLGAADAVLLQRVGREPRLEPARVALPLVEEDAEHLRDA